MNARKISLIGLLIVVSLIVSGIAVVNKWKRTPYGTLHTNAALLLKVIEFRISHNLLKYLCSEFNRKTQY